MMLYQIPIICTISFSILFTSLFVTTHCQDTPVGSLSPSSQESASTPVSIILFDTLDTTPPQFRRKREVGIPDDLEGSESFWKKWLKFESKFGEKWGKWGHGGGGYGGGYGGGGYGDGYGGGNGGGYGGGYGGKWWR